MNRKSIALHFALAVTAFGLSAVPATAQTPPALRLTDGTNTITIDANNNITMSSPCACTTTASSGTAGNPGNVAWKGTLGNFTVNSSQGNAQNATYTNPDLQVNATYNGTGSGTLTVSWTSTGYTGSVIGEGQEETIFANGTGSVNYSYYIDNTDAVFGTGTLVGTVTLTTTGSSPIWDALSTGTFSVTEVEAITYNSAGTNFNGDNEFAMLPETVTVACPAATGKAGTAYSSSIVASGGTGSYTYAIIAGSLPAGLTLNTSTGAITGTPAAGAYSFTVEATDSSGTPSEAACSLSIATSGGGGQGPSLTLACPSNLSLTQGVYYSGNFTVTGGTAPDVFSITAGSLPQGLKLNTATGAVTGTPSGTGAFSFTGSVTDSSSPPLTAASPACTGTIAPKPKPLSLTCAASTGTVGVPYSSAVVASGGTPPYVSYKLVSGSLPPGLTLNTSTGAITGTPTKAGTYSYQIEVVDSNGALASDGSGSGRCMSSGCSITIQSPPPLSVKCPPSSATEGKAYTGSAVASGGTAPYTYSISSGSLPNGLTLNTSTGAITGTPTTPGTFDFTIGVKDSSGATGASGNNCSGGCSITVSPIISVSCPTGTATVGTAYDSTPTVTGGTAPYKWSVSAGSLPPGLNLNNGTGEIKGTPNTAGTYSFTLQVVDKNGLVGVSSSSSNNSGWGGSGWGGEQSGSGGGGCTITVSSSGGGQSGSGGCGTGSGTGGGFGGGWGGGW
ncbi:MAG TPA: Ig domain-containing protein [Bryobacteraceae bacterium]|nr:Ig domain-containing protein [Bryobacteraceae bacterium]